MHFVIGTTNKPKSEAIEQVLETCPYTIGQVTFSNHKAPSGVSDMPTTLEELRTGAKNRAAYCRREKPDSEYFVGMEGGVYKDYEGEEYWLIGVVYIENQEGRGHYGYSCHLQVPEAVVNGLFDGKRRDLEEVMHELGEVHNLGDTIGSFGAFTENMLSRKDSFVEATKCAIAPFFNKYYQI